MRIIVRSVFALCVIALSVASCAKKPTDMQLQITGNVDCKASPTVHIRVGTPENIETQPAKVVSTLCVGNGDLGTLTLTPPDGKDDATIAVTVIMAVGRDPATCVVGDSANCSEQRRILPFVAGKQINLPIHFLLSCVTNLCSAGTTCADDDLCVDAHVDAASCEDGPCFPADFPDTSKVTTPGAPDGSPQIGDDAQTGNDASGDGMANDDSSSDAQIDSAPDGPPPLDGSLDGPDVEGGKDGGIVTLDGGIGLPPPP